MAKKKYKFNPNTLRYERVGVSLKEKATRILAYFSSSLALGLFIFLIIIHAYETPKARSLARENNRLLSQYELMKKDLEKVELVLSELQTRDDNIYRVIFETEPIPSSIRQAGFGGTNKYTHLEDLDNAELVIGTSKKLDQLSKAAYIQSKSYDEVLEMALNKENMLASLPAIQPVKNEDLKRISSPWGYRIHPIYKVNKMHYGQDFTAPVGTPVYATGDGKVKEIKGSRRSKAGMGLYLVVNHGYGYETLYGHLDAFNVKRGQSVKRGDIIGYVGNTGGSTAPHVHYEVHKNGRPVNPAYYFFNDLTPQEFEKMIAISTNIGQSLD
jgi:murein DD-endopeptidase MepM/ murein hydrolase activator NlpD